MTSIQVTGAGSRAKASTTGFMIAVIAVCGFYISDHAFAVEQPMPGKITAVTVYRDQARVVRQLKIPAEGQLQQVRVSGLPAQMVARSAFTESDAGTNVRSMRVIQQKGHLNEEQLAKLEAVKDKKKDLLAKLKTSQNRLQAIEQDLLTVDQLVDFSADKVKQNLDRATLDVQSVTALADFAMERRRKLAQELLETENEIEQLTLDINQNEQQQRQLISAEAKLTYDALLTVDSPQGGIVRLVYDVGSVSWSPRYSIRASNNQQGARDFVLQLDALLVQDSGESWNDVSVTLATSTPDSQASRPLLTPFRIHAVTPGQQPTAQSSSANSIANQPAWIDHEMMQRNVRLNSQASVRQVEELTSAAEVQRKIAEDAGQDVSDETYLIDQRVTISNHQQLQTLTILSDQLEGKMHHVVTPLLSSFAFREAELTNKSGRNLIAGGADVYLDGEFVGRTTIPPTAAGQRLTVGFGTDRQIRSRRELLSRDENIHGGNRRSTLKHRLVVSNYHETPVSIRLLDRIPIAAKDGSINVSLEQAGTDKLSQDKLYLRMQRPTGVLRWDLEIPARKFGSEAYDHDYQYAIEFDRQQTLVSNDAQQMLGDLRFQKMNMGGGMGGGGSF